MRKPTERQLFIIEKALQKPVLSFEQISVLYQQRYKRKSALTDDEILRTLGRFGYLEARRAMKGSG